MSNWLSESVFGQAALALIKAIRYAIISGPKIVTDEAAVRRKHRTEAALGGRQCLALQGLKHKMPTEILKEAFSKPTLPDLLLFKTICGDNALFDDLGEFLLPKLISGELAIANAEQIGWRCA